MASPFQIIAAGTDYTDRAEDLTFSARDPGGFEACTFSVPGNDPITKGQRIRVNAGLEVAWEGRVADVQRTIDHGQAKTTISGVGYGAALKDQKMQAVYVDRDLSRWTAMSVQRRINLLGSSWGCQDPQTQPDVTTGYPSLTTELTGAWGLQSTAEAYYDAGAGNVIASLYYAWKAPGLPTNAFWNQIAMLSSDDVITTVDSSGNIRAAGPGTGTVIATGIRRFGALQLFVTTAAGTEGQNYPVWWTVLAVYGNHGLTKRGTADAANAQGFYPSDIARHALTATPAGIKPGVIVDASGLVVPHAVYRDPTDPEKVVDDMAKLMGWHYGTWEGGGALEDQPRFDFRPPPAEATAHVSRLEVDELDVTEHLDNLYNQAVVAYTDAAGSLGLVTVTRNVDELNQAGLTRTLSLNMGTGNAAQATTFGAFALALAERQERAAGTATLPQDVGLPGGGRKPAYLLRPGLDRLAIRDMPSAYSLLDTRQLDTFHLARTETRVGPGGVPATTCEFDVGGNLLEVLQARFSMIEPLVSAG